MSQSVAFEIMCNIDYTNKSREMMFGQFSRQINSEMEMFGLFCSMNCHEIVKPLCIAFNCDVSILFS